jgi:hypothetical protein
MKKAETKDLSAPGLAQRPSLIFENSIVGLSSPLDPHETWKWETAALLSALPGPIAFSLLVLTERPHPTRLFLKNRGPRQASLLGWKNRGPRQGSLLGWKKSRTSLPCPVQSRSEDALKLQAPAFWPGLLFSAVVFKRSGEVRRGRGPGWRSVRGAHRSVPSRRWRAATAPWFLQCSSASRWSRCRAPGRQ